MNIRYLMACLFRTAFLIACIHGSDTLHQIILRAKDQYELKSIVLISSHQSQAANRFLTNLQHNISVPVVHYRDLRISEFSHNRTQPTETLMDNFGDWLLYIVFLDEFETRQAVLENAFRLMEGRQYSKVIFEIKKSTRQILQGLFHRCFDYGMLRVVIRLRTFPSTLFTYRPFDGFKIVQIAENSELFTTKVLNLNKHKLKTIRSGHPPSAVWHKTKSGLFIPKGYTGHLVVTFAEKRNASLEIAELTDEKSPLEELSVNIVKKQIDFTMSAVAVFGIGIGEYAYPTAYEKFCIVVPAAQTIPTYQNFTLPFHTETWLLLIFGLGYFAFVIYIVITIVANRKDFSGAFLTALCMLMNISGIGVFYKNNPRVIVFYVPLFIFGFIMTNLYLAFLTTFLTSPAYERPIRTWNDIERAGLKIVTERVELEHVLKMAPDLSVHSNLFEPVYYPEFVHIRETLNNSNAVMMNSGIWSSMDDIQRYTNNFKFQDSGIPIIPMYFSIIFKCESPIIQDFRDHIMMAYQSGLIYHWRKNAFLELLQENLLNTTKTLVDNGPVPLDIATLKISFLTLIFGLIMSILTFCIEIFEGLRKI